MSRIEELYRDICEGRERRAALSALKQEVRDADRKKELLSVTGNRLDEIMKCLTMKQKFEYSRNR